jgi:hypothetical protein
MHKKEGKSYEVHKRSTHMDHETSPLFDVKMPKIMLIAKLMDTYFKSSPK